MIKSKIFTEAELKVINQRMQDDKSDKTGIFSNRIKPKIVELLEVWMPKKDDLKKIIKVKDTNKRFYCKCGLVFISDKPFQKHITQCDKLNAR